MLQPNGKLYESFTVFCPKERLELLELIEKESILIDWDQPLYMNFTHKAIMDRIEEFYSARGGVMEKIAGDIYVLEDPISEDIKLEE